MNVHVKDGIKVEFAAYEGDMKIEEGLRYMTHIAVLRLAHSNGRDKFGHAWNI